MVSRSKAATLSPLLPFHLGAEELSDDGGASFRLGFGLVVDPGDEVVGEANWDGRGHGF